MRILCIVGFCCMTAGVGLCQRGPAPFYEDTNNVPVSPEVHGDRKVTFRLFAPNEIFPVSYRRGSKAHLEIGDARAEAIRRAVRDQLGLTVLDIEPFGQEGSAGSTPLRLRVQGDPDTYVFAKLYTQSHVRAEPRFGSNRCQSRSARSNVSPARSSARNRSPVNHTR